MISWDPEPLLVHHKVPLVVQLNYLPVKVYCLGSNLDLMSLQYCLISSPMPSRLTDVEVLVLMAYLHFRDLAREYDLSYTHLVSFQPTTNLASNPI